ncbi:MAG: hypothetical protein QXX33_03655 [Candidatus Hadarchaeales archaeon]
MKPVGPSEEVFCPNCKRYVGTLEKCPYCGSKVPKRLSFRLLKWGGLSVAVLGVLFLCADVRGLHIIAKQPYQIAISDLFKENATLMNMGQAVLTGKATFVKFYEDTNFLGMYLVDPENSEASIFIRAYDATTKALIRLESERLAKGSPIPAFPAVGDIVTVRGSLRVRAVGDKANQFQMLIVQYPEGFLKIERPAGRKVRIHDVVHFPENFTEYERLEVTGKVISIDDLGFAKNLTLYEVETQESMNIMIPKFLERFGGAYPAIGAKITVSGALQSYYGTPQLWVASWEDIKVIP